MSVDSDTKTGRTYLAFIELQAAKKEQGKRDDAANRERLAMARVTMDQALEDGYDCE